MNLLKTFVDILLGAYSMSVLIITCMWWNELKGYPTTAWVLTFLFILLSGRILLFFSYRFRLSIVIMFRLFYFLISNIWAIVGVIFYIKATEGYTLDPLYKGIMIISIVICFMISFVLRRGSLRIPFRAAQNYQRIDEPRPVVRNLKVVKEWVTKFEESEKENCAICCEEFKFKQKLVKIPDCGHYFHYGCITDWIKVKTLCPICKADLERHFNS